MSCIVPLLKVRVGFTSSLRSMTALSKCDKVVLGEYAKLNTCMFDGQADQLPAFNY